jgi:predicted neuraminidase
MVCQLIPTVIVLSLKQTNPVLSSEFIYEKAPYPSCHASTIAETTRHGLVAAWFGGTAESNPDVVIYMSRWEHGKWTDSYAVANGIKDGERYPCYNPVLFQSPSGPLLLFYKYGRGPQTWHGRMTSSLDGGKTWSPSTDLPDGVLGPIKNKPILVGRNTLLCPSSTEDQGWRVRFETTQGLGKTWKVSGYVNSPSVIGAIQPSILRMGGRRLRAVGRTQQERVFAVDSQDNGKTWGPMKLLDVLNPNSGIDAVTLRDRRHVLVYNNTPKGRTPLNLAISSDGEHWKPVLTLEDEPGEYSYPAVIQTSDGLVHITYTWHRERIKHVVVDPKRL